MPFPASLKALNPVWQIHSSPFGGNFMIKQLLPSLYVIHDTCNVYLIQEGEYGLAIDFGSGRWLAELPALGIRQLEHVLLTHAHEDQCAGLAAHSAWPFAIHAPAGEEAFLSPQRNSAVLPPWLGIGCPLNYMPPRQPVADVMYDIIANGHLFWRKRRLRFLHTPGHGPHACSILLDHLGKQILFCGDAVYANGTIWQPFHLEWDHWTGTGALAAWEGIERLRGIAMDLLCPAHGPVLSHPLQFTLQQLSRRLLSFYQAKGQISPRTKDGYLEPIDVKAGALQYLPHLYQYAGNGYLLVSESGRALVVDPHEPEMPALEALLNELNVVPTAMLVTHYHYDHCDGIAYLQARYGAQAWLHPLIAEALQPGHWLPWKLARTISAPHLWPAQGLWHWEEYAFHIAPWPGQTYWHCVFMTTIDGYKVLFGGDNFTPTSKWNGTGGFCAYNGSRFGEGFVASAQLALDWQPDIVAAAHNNTYAFSAPKFRRIIRWAQRAEKAVRALCPTGDLQQDYYVVHNIIAQYKSSGD